MTTENLEASGRAGARPRTILNAGIVALQVALIGSVMLGLVECVSAAVFTAKHFEGDRWPLRLIAAAIGKATLTHVIFWMPVLVLFNFAAHTLSRVQNSVTPLLSAWGVFLCGTAIMIVPADLKLATKLDWTAIYAISAAIGLAGIIATYCIFRVQARTDGSLLRSVFWVSTVCALIVIVGAGIIFFQSPFFHPAQYRATPRTTGGTLHERPHVLWIVMDTVRADRVGCFGYAKNTTPFVDSWAQKSIVFSNTIGNGMWTVPSHTSMFTGASVRRHGMGGDERKLDDRFDTVAEVLSGEGYVTASFSNNPWISRNINIVQGFDAAHVIYQLRHLSRFSWEALLERWGMMPPLPWLDRDFGGALTNHLVSNWLDAYAAGSAPMFLFVNYMEAHLPYTVPKQFQLEFMSEPQVDRSYELRHNAYGTIMDLLDRRYSLGEAKDVVQADLEIYKRQYEAGIRYVDHRVKELIGMFDQRGLLKNTLVVLVSDHGEHLDTHGMWAHRYLTYNDLTHVMMMIREPGRNEPLRIDTPVQPSDLYASVLNHVLGEAPPTAPEESLDLFDLAHRGGEPRTVITECMGPSRKLRKRLSGLSDPRLRHLATPQIAAQDGRFKYIASGDGMRELYDLSTDPGELDNLVDRKPDEAQRLAAYIKSWQDQIPIYIPPDSEEQAEMDPDFLEALKSLGYLGD